MYKPTGTALGSRLYRGQIPPARAERPGFARGIQRPERAGQVSRLPEPVFGGRTGLASVSVLFRSLPFFPQSSRGSSWSGAGWPRDTESYL